MSFMISVHDFNWVEFVNERCLHNVRSIYFTILVACRRVHEYRCVRVQRMRAAQKAGDCFGIFPCALGTIASEKRKGEIQTTAASASAGNPSRAMSSQVVC
ncbi:MAG: hypothetical protein KatS3mg049_0369 [Caldilinea sp.]|nr:MAG: hypothetical protein KatS3mg049_0369 [Caldilinea sp.]